MPKRAKTKNPHEPKRRKTTVRRTKSATAFPALTTVQTPGQPRSREAFAEFEDHHESADWWADYTHLRNEGFTWRIAAYIAWASSPLKRRWPATLKELATKVLGLKSDKVIYKWRKLYPKIDERIEKFKAEPLLRYRSDVLYALVDVASTHDPSAHNDRKLFLEMSGDYKPRSALDMTGRFNVADESLDAAIERELAALATGSEAGNASAAGAAQQQPD